jgi:O-antigen/teichoic acid export membrane protein
MGAALALTVLLARGLSARDFGFFALVSAILLLVRSQLDLGVANVVAREAIGSQAGERQVLEDSMGFRLALGVVASVACVGLALSQSGGERAVLLGAAGVLLLMHQGAVSIVFQVRQAQGSAALITIAGQAATLAGGLALLAIRAPGYWFAALIVAREGCVVLGQRALAVRLLGYPPRPALTPTALARLIRMCLKFGLATVFYNLAFQQGLFLVRWLRPEAELGAFAAALRPIAPLIAIQGILMSPVVPFLTGLAPDGPALRRQVWGALRLALGVGAIAAVSGALLAPAVIRVLYADRFADVHMGVVTTFRWLSVGLGCAFVIEVAAVTLLSQRRDGWLLALSLCAWLVNLAVSLFLLPRYGLQGAAMGVGAGAAFGALVGVAMLVSLSGAEALAGSLVFLLPAVGLAVALSVLGGPPLLRVGVGAAATLVALAVLWRLPGVGSLRREQAALSGSAPAP